MSTAEDWITAAGVIVWGVAWLYLVYLTDKPPDDDESDDDQTKRSPH